MYRYLLNVAYLGKNFRGSQIQLNPLDRTADDPLTITGRVQMGLKQLKPKNLPIVKGSSRTDAGVNAFHSTMHVDLTRPNGKPYDPRSVTHCLNRYFIDNDLTIRVMKTFIVPNTFDCCTNAISRTYLYRLGIVTTKNLDEYLCSHKPIEELDRCCFVGVSDFDVDKMREAAKLFLGMHDFRTFMGKPQHYKDKVTRRTVEMLNIVEGNSRCYSDYSWPSCTSSNSLCYKFYDIYMRSPGFLYRQVRRTVGSLIGVAQGKVTTKDIKFMLEIPSSKSWNPILKSVPANGLYLCEVAYSRRDLETFKDKLEDVQ